LELTWFQLESRLGIHRETSTEFRLFHALARTGGVSTQLWAGPIVDRDQLLNFVMEEDAGRQERALELEHEFPDLSRVVRGDWDDEDCREVAGLWTFPRGAFGQFSELAELTDLPETHEETGDGAFEHLFESPGTHEDVDDGTFGHFSEPPETDEDTDTDDSAESG
jgi:hypothetical protein